MKLHTTHSLMEIASTLDKARQDPANRCLEPRKDAKGRTSFTMLKPRARKGSSNRVSLPYGAHASGYLAIDPETLEVHCGACKGELDATATPPPGSLEAEMDAAEANQKNAG